uniref:Major facilitator superfamily (MFS) profile domain-containing protein n=1 Tax=Brassica oleracea var. oleracea TaxID=109376 RepID=A0A0D3CVI1_BRAOL
MAWFSDKISLGGFPDLTGAVNKFQESVKNIEKNFDNALGFDDKPESAGEASSMWPPVMSFMGNTSDEKLDTLEDSEKSENPPQIESNEEEGSGEVVTELAVSVEANKETNVTTEADQAEVTETVVLDPKDGEPESQMALEDSQGNSVQQPGDTSSLEPDEKPELAAVSQESQLEPPKSEDTESEAEEPMPEEDAGTNDVSVGNSDAVFSPVVADTDETKNEQESQSENLEKRTSSVNVEVSPDTDNLNRVEPSDAQLSLSTESAGSANESSVLKRSPSDEISERVVDFVSRELDSRLDGSELIDSQRSSSATNASDSVDVVMELEKTKKEMKMLENALQGAARQAQAKADEIAKLMHENEQLKSATEDLKRKSNEAEVESLREEYHQRVATLERKVYALTKERDTLRREHNKKSDAAALLKEKDEIINQVMAEGEELSKKQAAQEGQIRKLRAQIREVEEEKKGLITKLQSEENKVESIKRDKTATEKLLQETIEKHQAELASQKEYYSNALAAAKEAQALAEERTNNEARIELENRLKEAGERESMLVQALEELRQTLSKKEQQVVFREDMFRRELEDLQRRYQASERRCEELITQVPESTRPLLRQIEAMQETTARRAEAWGAVERTLNARLQEAETKAATAEERERSVNERLSQTLSRINVLEAQLSCLRAEQGQLSKSLEKERQRAAENRQEYLAAKEEADTLGGRANQLEVEIMELRRKHKQELQEVLLHNELIQKDLEREKATRLDLERTARINPSTASEQLPISRQNSTYENGGLQRKLSSASSLGSMEESYFLQASLDSSDKSSEKRSMPEATMSPYYMKSITPSAYEATLRQKEGELASYMSRLASMESIRDSLAEELVKMTAECEKLRGEADRVPGIKAELEALRQRHAAALELMGERDEELEELRADIVDLKEMYKEQVNMLVNKGRSVEAKQVIKTRRIIVSLGRRVKRIWAVGGQHISDDLTLSCCDEILDSGTFLVANVTSPGMDSVRRTYTMMRGRHIEKRVPSKELLSVLDKAETAVTGTGKDIGNPSWKRSLPHVFVASLTSLLFGYHLGVVNETLESISIDLGFSGNTIAEGLVVSTCLGGAFIGSLFSGLVADGVGRRRAFQLSALPMIIGASVSATTESLEGMLLGRFFVGIGMGIGPSVTALYVTEVSPAYVRGTYGSSTQIATCLGLLASLFAGIPAKDNFGWWRICFWISTVPAVVLAVFMELCAESPQWLFKRGRAAEAEVVFEKLLGGAYVKAAMAELVKSDRGDDADSAKLSELLFGRSFRVVFIGSTLFALQQLSGINAVFYFSSTVFKKAGVPSASANICVGVCNLLGSTVAVVLMDKLGRKVLLIGSFAGMAVSLGLQALAHTSYSSTFGTLFLSVGGMLLFVLSFATGAGPVPSILLSEICPGRLRATALAVCLAVHWVINFFVGLLFLRMLEQLGSVLLNAIFGFFCVVAVIFVQKNVIETKGKSLQEIEISLLSATSQ